MIYMSAKKSLEILMKLKALNNKKHQLTKNEYLKELRQLDTEIQTHKINPTLSPDQESQLKTLLKI